jgi:hypothetical protein
MLYINIDMPSSCFECPLYNKETGCFDKNISSDFSTVTGRMFGCPLKDDYPSLSYASKHVWNAATLVHCMSDEELKECFNAESPMEVFERFKEEPFKVCSIIREYLSTKENKLNNFLI